MQKDDATSTSEAALLVFGVDEGVVADPPSCKWQPEMVACGLGEDDTDCLSAPQVAAVQFRHNHIRTSNEPGPADADAGGASFEM